jgi:chloramphenicol-sensitive protein RarD
MGEAAARTRMGVLYGLAAYIAWGLVPLFFNQIRETSAKEIIAHRIVWTAVLLTFVISLARGWPRMAAVFRDRKMVLTLFVSAVLVASNWFVYVYAATSGQITQASLGYFILPMVNALVGVTVFRERLRPLQGVALLCSGIGVVYMTVSLGEFPRIGLFLAVTFSLYGIVRKVTPVDGITGLAVETYLLTPFALATLIYWEREGILIFGHVSRSLDVLIACTGIVTAFPLVCFAQAMRRVSLVTMGFIQYISPSIALAIAVLVYGELFTVDHRISFGFIWLGVLCFLVDAVRKKNADVVAD